MNLVGANSDCYKGISFSCWRFTGSPPKLAYFAPALPSTHNQQITNHKSQITNHWISLQIGIFCASYPVFHPRPTNHKFSNVKIGQLFFHSQITAFSINVKLNTSSEIMGYLSEFFLLSSHARREPWCDERQSSPWGKYRAVLIIIIYYLSHLPGLEVLGAIATPS